MIIALTATGKELDSKIDLRFGRAKFIIFYDTDKKVHTVENNNLNLNAAQGAGIQTAQRVVENNANAIVSGNLGPKAFQVLNAADVKIYCCKDMSIAEAIEAYNNSSLKEIDSPNVQGHWS